MTISNAAVHVVQLSMYLDQHSGGKGGHQEVAKGSFAIPFRNWQPGYVVTASRSQNDEEWTIKNIVSADGKPHREDCVITLVNKAEETREVKGSTAQSGYEFKSTGDVPPPAPEERSDVKPFGVQLEGIREWYPRANGEGTRIIMHDKTAYIVLESFTTIWDLMIEAGIAIGPHTDRSKRKPVEGAMTGAELQGN